MAITTTYSFSSDASFTYDNTKVAFTSGKVQLKDQRLANATFYATLATSIDADWQGAAGAAIGAGAISSGVLNGDSSSPKGAKWLQSVLNQVGAVRFTVIPQYSGTPGGSRCFFSAHHDVYLSINAIQIEHKADGALHFTVKDQSGNTYATASGAWSPTAGTAYEIEFNTDTTTGAHRLFVDGSLIASQTGATGTRYEAYQLQLGSSYDNGYGGQANYKNLLVFDAVQHTAGYTPATTAPGPTVYDVSNPTVTTNSAITLDALLAFTSVFEQTGSDAVKFRLLISGVEKYWNGTAWAVSDGSYTQSNTASDINAHAADLGTTVNGTLKIITVLHSASGTTTPKATSVGIQYDFYGLEPDGSATCTVWGYLNTPSGAPISGATLQVTVAKTYSNQGLLISQGVYSVKSDVYGYFEIDLRETTTANVTYAFSILSADKKSTQQLGSALIPNSVGQNIATLSFT